MPTNNDKPSGYDRLTKLFQRNPTIENYVALRRAHPGKIIGVTFSGGMEWLFQNAEMLKRFEIDPELVAGAMDCDPRDISELSLLLMERLISREKALKSGRSQLVSRKKAISDRLVNYLITVVLDSMEWQGRLFFSR